MLRDAAREAARRTWRPQCRGCATKCPTFLYVAAFLVLDREGRVVARTNEAPRSIRASRIAPSSPSTATGGRAGSPERAVPVVASGNWRFTLSRRIETSGGRFDGVVAAAMEIGSFDRLYRAIDLGTGGFITLPRGKA